MPDKANINQQDGPDARAVQPLTEKVIKPIVRRNLRVSLRPDDTSRENQNGLELVGDIQASLLAAIHLQDRNGNALLNIEAYATTVSANACHQYLRSRFPARANLENALRYFLSHTDGYAIWQDAGKRWLCGRSTWRNDAVLEPRSIPQSADNVPLIGRGSREKYTAILQSVFEATGGPVTLEELVPYVMRVLGVTERIEIGQGDDASDSLEYISVPSPEPSIHSHLETVGRLRTIWDAVRGMSRAHRNALLLSLRDEGGSLLAVLLLSGIASVREIADVLGFTLDEFAAIWDTLPWDDLRIAEHLGITRQQVINLRQTARARLLRLADS